MDCFLYTKIGKHHLNTMSLYLPSEPWISIERATDQNVAAECKGFGMIYFLLLSLFLLIVPIYIPKDVFERAIKHLDFDKIKEELIKNKSDAIDHLRHSSHSLTTISYRVGGTTYESIRSLVDKISYLQVVYAFSRSGSKGTRLEI